MTIKIAINGFGRIGRLTARALLEGYKNYDMELVAINDLTDVKTNAHLLQYDSVHRKFGQEVTAQNDNIIVDGKTIHAFAEKDPTKLPWKDLGVDVVFECTGVFKTKEKATAHLNGGAKKVIISAPAGKEVDATIVYGVNHNVLKASDTVISNASCTTNCLAPLVKPLHDKIGIVNGLMTTIHSYTNDQHLTDLFHSDLRRARSATQSMIPTKTGAAEAVGLVLPELAGKLTGFAMRVPTINVSVVDLTFLAARDTSVEEINSLMKQTSEGELKGILAYNDKPLVSIDFNHDPHSSTFDASYTKIIDRTVKVLSWYDNEWGFSCRMLDTAVAFMGA
jgi:glyceraldehyde 3-phosphate dehydrogenase